MFSNPFKKKNGGGLDIDAILSLAKSFGFDVFEFAEKKLPELLAAALQLEHRAGSRLMGTLSISDDSQYFILSLFKLSPTGQAELWQTYPLHDIPAIIEKIKQAVSTPSHASDATPEHLTLSSGGSQPDALSTTAHQLPATDDLPAGNPAATADGFPVSADPNAAGNG